MLNTHRWIAKNLWNELLAYVKETYDKTGKFPTKNELQSLTKNKGLYSQASQEISHRVHSAMVRFFKLRKQGKEVGFPRFRNIDRMKSIHYPQSGFSIIGKKLKVAPFGEINMVIHRKMEGKIKTLSLKRESSGKWFAVFVVEQDDITFKSNGKDAVGMDLGLKTFATLSNGTKINNPRHIAKYAERLAFYQKRLSRKQKGSHNRFWSKRKVAKIYEKILNTRADFLHKTSTQLVNSYSLIALEKLHSQDMARQNYGKQINDAGWNSFANTLTYKAGNAGCQVVFVDARGTTKTCHVCGNRQEMPLNERTYDCIACGSVTDRDINASINILHKATTEGQSGSNAWGDTNG